MNAVVPMSQQARARKTAWQRAQRAAFKAANGYSTTANYGAGGNRARVLDRDGRRCVACGMTEAEHLARWSRPITIDHVNRNRRDNSLSNLQTLCLECHGRKDLIPALRASKASVLLPRMQAMRAEGSTYQAIADAVGLSIGAVHKNLNRSRK